MLSTNLMLAAATALLSGASEAQYLNTTKGAGYISYSTVTGFFLQDEPDTVASGFDYVRCLLETCRHRHLTELQTAVNFGLINQTYPGSATGNTTQWQRFAQVVDSLNANAELNTAYKVLFMGRHGEGFHNAAESYYGTPAWNVCDIIYETQQPLANLPAVLLVRARR